MGGLIQIVLILHNSENSAGLIKALERFRFFMIDLKTRFHGLGHIILTRNELATARIADTVSICIGMSYGKDYDGINDGRVIRAI